MGYPPYCLVTNSKADGFSVALLKETLKIMNHEVSFYVDAWAKVKNDLEIGAIDVLPLVGRTPERDALFDFSVPYLVMHGAIVVRDEDDSIHSFADLAQKSVLVMQDDNAHEYLLRKKGDYKIVSVPSFEEALKILSQGKHDAVVVQKLVAVQLIAKLKLPNLKIVSANIEDFRQDFSFAVHEGDKELLAILNEGLSIVMANGTYAKLYKKWLMPFDDKNPQLENTIKILVSLLALLVMISAVGLLWHRSLKKQVALKTRQLSESKNQLAALNDSLHHRIQNAIAELKEKDQLMITQSRQAAMGEMISMIAHQWRQPLSIISMIANNLSLEAELENNLENSQIQTALQEINQQVQHLSTTIDDFKNFFKPNKEKQSLHVSQIVDDTLHIIGSLLRNNTIEFITEIEEDREILIYRNEIIQVLINLINNAKDALQGNKNPKIIFRAFSDEKGLHLCVIDNAGGIAPEILSKLGEPYVSTKALSGTGLGIYLSKMIIQKHFGGELTWQNLKNGACFCICLPQ
ncbi:MAG: transporter substrate-binding domain-containing protein [Sulfurospirillum sp.]|nr:transporter substrate-binding domain-containing protein [Sulfurospirillum sp.]